MPGELCELTQVFRLGELRCSELWSRAGLMTKLPGMIYAVSRRFLWRQGVSQTQCFVRSSPVSQSALLCRE